MSWLQQVGDAISGSASQGTYQNAENSVAAPDQAASQISGLGNYTGTLGALSSQVPSTPNFTGATAGTMSQEQNLQNYFQNVANGNQNTAADQTLQNSQAAGARQLQSGEVSAQGQSPALAMRQLFANQATQQGNIAGQSAQQKLQEQQQGASNAMGASANIFGQQTQNLQQTYSDTMNSLNSQAQMAQGVFNANAAQTSYNMQYQSNQMAYQQYQAGLRIQASQAANAGWATLLKVGAQAGAAAASGGVSAAGSKAPAPSGYSAADPTAFSGGGA